LADKLAPFVVQIKRGDRGSSSGGSSDEEPTLPKKVFRPIVLSRMEQTDIRAGFRVIGLDSIGLVQIAEDTNRLHPKFSLVDPPSRSP
jgi:hypothetical protein